MNKEKTNYQIKNITTLNLEDGTTINKPKDIIKAQKKYYQDLYTEKNTYSSDIQHGATKYFLKSPDIPTIDEDQKQIMDQQLTLEDLSQATQDLPNLKAPGTNEIPVDFY